MTTKSGRSLYNAAFRETDIFLFGQESAGVPAEIAAACEFKLKIPIVPAVRSLNLAMAAGIATSEVLRQTGKLPPARSRGLSADRRAWSSSALDGLLSGAAIKPEEAYPSAATLRWSRYRRPWRG